ncbi:MAG: FkbM family methyltransferase [Promethearchaeota archaeon]
MALNHKLDKNEINFVDYIYKNTKKNKLTVFDVGCNRGLYVGLFSNKHINSDIHCFEPINKLFNELKNKYGTKENITLNNLCVSDSNKKVTFHELINPITDGCSSIIERPIFKERGWKYNSYEVESISIDNYCKNNNIEHIDFIKIDVEGAEFLVLKGCENMLKTSSIDFIQFEYGNTFSDANIELLDVYNLIDSHGYKMFTYEIDKFINIHLNNISEYSKIQICNFIIKKPA